MKLIKIINRRISLCHDCPIPGSFRRPPLQANGSGKEVGEQPTVTEEVLIRTALFLTRRT